MHFKTTFFLLLALAVLAGVLWISSDAPPRAVPTRSVARKLLPLEPEKIKYVSFSREGNFITCHHEQGQWMLHKPLLARADAERINRLLAGLEMLVVNETISAAQRQARNLTLADYGLDNPRARLVIGDAERRYLLAVGQDAPLKNSVYVQLDNGDDVLATSTNLWAIIPREVAELRDHRLLQGSAFYVRRLDLRCPPGPLLQLVKEGSEWVLNKPLLARADAGKVAALLEQLFALTAREFVTETMSDPAAYGLNDDELRLQVSLWQEGENNVERLLFGQPVYAESNALYAARRDAPTVFTVERSKVEALRATLDDLRDARLYFMAPEKMALIRIEQGERALQFRKQAETGWSIVTPQHWPADPRLMADLIFRLNTFRAEATLTNANLAALGLERPGQIIRIAEAAAAEASASGAAAPAEKLQRVLLLSAPQPGQAYVFAHFEGEPLTHRISASSAWTLSLDPLHYRDNTVLALAPASIRRIIVQRGATQQAAEQLEAGAWRLTAPETGAINLNVLTNLLAAVSNLKVLRYERSEIQDLAMYGLKDPPLALTFILQGAAGIQKTLLLGEDSEDFGVYAMLQGQDAVFVLEKTLANAMGRELAQ